MADKFTLTGAEEKLAEIIWAKAPLTSPELVDISFEELGWKKSTTYTVLRRLCEKGIFVNGNARVTVNLTREDLVASQSRQFVKSAFGGSLPGFIASFFGGKKLSLEEADELRQLIEAHQEES